jgi:hypothetical protein
VYVEDPATPGVQIPGKIRGCGWRGRARYFPGDEARFLPGTARTAILIHSGSEMLVLRNLLLLIWAPPLGVNESADVDAARKK